MEAIMPCAVKSRQLSSLLRTYGPPERHDSSRRRRVGESDMSRAGQLPIGLGAPTRTYMRHLQRPRRFPEIQLGPSCIGP